MNASEDNSQKASSDSQNTDSSNATVSSPVSLTLSVVGDCTLGTDETFDYDTSLNAYYENYGADYFLQNVKDIFSADDLTIAILREHSPILMNGRTKHLRLKHLHPMLLF